MDIRFGNPMDGNPRLSIPPAAGFLSNTLSDEMPLDKMPPDEMLLAERPSPKTPPKKLRAPSSERLASGTRPLLPRPLRRFLLTSIPNRRLICLLRIKNTPSECYKYMHTPGALCFR